jgi:SAM-dependent methyltransferase
MVSCWQYRTAGSDKPPAHKEVGVTDERYTFGDEAAILCVFQRRTLAECASFFVPHLHPGMAVLDCGCGPGSVTVDIAELVAPGSVVGIDTEAGQFDQARSLATERGATNVRFEQADAYALPFPDASFDAAFSHALVSHLGEPVRALAEQRRVLKPGGVVGVVENDAGAFVCSPTGLPRSSSGRCTCEYSGTTAGTDCRRDTCAGPCWRRASCVRRVTLARRCGGRQSGCVWELWRRRWSHADRISWRRWSVRVGPMLQHWRS